MKDNIHFAHANGFPSPCYRKLFSYLLDEYDLSYIDTLGHHQDYPVTNNWHYLTQELIDSILRFHQEPVIGLGHSLGGVLQYLAARERPDLFKAVILLDSPLFSPLRNLSIRFLKKLGLINWITPAGKTQRRRTQWPDAESAFQHLKDKPLFKLFDEDCLRDYILFGMDHHEHQVSLRFNREIEYAIYRSMPDNLHNKPQVQVPLGLLYGENSYIVRAKEAKHMQASYHFKVQCVAGDHLFPFEYPRQSAEAIKTMISQLLATNKE